jgi:hypothetical protein
VILVTSVFVMGARLERRGHKMKGSGTGSGQQNKTVGVQVKGWKGKKGEKERKW